MATALNKKTLFYQQDLVLLENERLRHIMREMIVITKDPDLSNDFARIAIRKCLEHALRELPIRAIYAEER